MTKQRWQVLWDNGHASDTLPEVFDDPEIAAQHGREWKAQMVAIDEDPTTAEETYSWEVVPVRLNYYKGDFLVVPMQVKQSEQGKQPTPPNRKLLDGAHWVGWVTVLNKDHEGSEHSWAVWQDYRKRGFFIWQPGWEKPEVVPLYFGEGLEGLFQHLAEMK